jgi:serine/threonine protein kinase
MRMPDEKTLSVGQTIGMYEILDDGHEWDLEVNYAARHAFLDRAVFMRFPVPVGHKLYAESLYGKFRESARLLARLKHPNINELFDAGEYEDRPYIVLARLSGRALHEVVDRDEQLPLNTVLQISADISDAIHHFHENGLLHRNIKPGAIILSDEGVPVIKDFTLATAMDNGLGTRIKRGDYLGTPGFMAPEHATGGEYTVKSEIWAIGAILFLLLTGDPPHTGDMAAKLDQAKQGAPIDFSRLPSDLPDYVRTVVKRCLAANPENRWPSAKDLANALRLAAQMGEKNLASTVQFNLPRPGARILMYMENVGSRTEGPYRELELISFLGSGQFGSVYSARDCVTKQQMALKFLKEEWLGNEEVVQRFRRETGFLTRLNHPNLLKAYNFGRYGPYPFIATELMDGNSLRDILSQNAPLHPGYALTIFGQIIAGLEALHETGLIHRDLKPGNVGRIIDRFVICDFGLAHDKDLSSLTVTGTVMGTAAYMSPEQAAGRKTDTASDIYSAGVILYEMLTKNTPHQAQSLAELLRRIILEPPPPLPPQLELPPEIADVLDATLQKEPNLRPTASEIKNRIMADSG